MPERQNTEGNLLGKTKAKTREKVPRLVKTRRIEGGRKVKGKTGGRSEERYEEKAMHEPEIKIRIYNWSGGDNN